MKLADKVAIVTGSARGVGKAIATTFVSEGASVVIADMLSELAQQTANELKSKGGKATAIKVDITKKAEVQELVKKTLETLGAVHILVNNAGITRHAPLLEITEEDWDTVLDVDLKGVFLCTQAVLPAMMKQRYGKIINISSVAGFGGEDWQANYVAAKAGVIAFTKSASRTAGPFGININSIAPGTLLTDMKFARRTNEEVEKFLEERKKRSVLGRIGKVEDIAKLALFLASDDSSFITGQTIIADGGKHDRM